MVHEKLKGFRPHLFDRPLVPRRRARGTYAACGLASLLLTGACTTSSEWSESNFVRTKTQNSTVAPQFVVFQEALNAEAILAASDWLELGDGVKVSTDGSSVGVANTGIGITRIGSDARVGDVWSRGPVDLRDRAWVAGAIYANNVQRGNQTTIEDGRFPSPAVTTPLTLDVPAFAAQKPAIRLEPNQHIDLEPGSYQTLELKSGSSATLVAGDYRFGSLMIHNGGTLQFQDECDAAEIYVDSSFTFRGKITTNSAVEPAVFNYLGSNTAHIEAPFLGAVLAPNAELILSSATHRGRFAAKRLRVQAWAKIQGLSSENDGQCAPKRVPQGEAEPIVPNSIGAAPGLQAESDLDEFLEWYYHIRTEHLQEARDAIAGVSVSAEVLSGLITRFEAARSARRIGKGVMLLSLIGCMDLPAAETYLIDVLREQLPNVPDDVDDPRTTMFSSMDYEIAFRAKALTVLLTRDTTNAQTAVLDIAKNHPHEELRGHAIEALSYGLSDAEKTQLKNQLQLADEHHVYRPHRTEPDFDAKVQHYVNTY